MEDGQPLASDRQALPLLLDLDRAWVLEVDSMQPALPLLILNYPMFSYASADAYDILHASSRSAVASACLPLLRLLTSGDVVCT